MEQIIHSVQILRSILQQRGPDYLREGGGKFFVNAFAELGGDKQDVKLLRYLIQCGGHEDLLNAGSQTPAMQRNYYSRVVQKLCDEALISEDRAHGICNVFWQAVYDRQPPIVYPESKQKPVIEFKPAQGPVHRSEDTGMTPEELYRRGMTYYQAPNQSLRQWWPNAVKYLEKAAEQGHMEAQIRLGFMYSWRSTKEELGIQDADARSVFWFRKAAEQGDTNAQIHLSRYYRDGTGVEQDYDRALYWCNQAAEQNDVEAMNELRYLYGYRLNMPQLALEWCKKAAELGYAECQWRLGSMYEEGFCTSIDNEKALYWYQKAAAQGARFAADRIPQVESKLKMVKKAAAPSDSPSLPHRDFKVPDAPKQDKRKEDPLGVWKSILKGLSLAQMAISLLAIVLLGIRLVLHQEWIWLIFMIAHLWLISEANKALGIQKEPSWRYLTGGFLLFLAAVFGLAIVEAAISMDWEVLSALIGIMGSAPLLARMGIECLIGCRLKNS